MRMPTQYIEVDYLANARDLRLLVNQGAGSYDAIYLHLALQRDLPICTCDKGIVALQARIPRMKVLDLDHTAFTG